MTELIPFIKELGAESIDLFWLPLAIWTILAAVAIVISRAVEKIPSIYQYHGRVAVIWTLPLGIAISALLYWISTLSTQSAAASAKFIVITNPITVSAAGAEQSFNWADPVFWLGLITVIAAAAALFGMFKLAANVVSLKTLTYNLIPAQTVVPEELSEKNKDLLTVHCPNTTVSFSGQVEVPCTFGWRTKWVLLPESLRHQPEKMNIAIRHELMHICQADYLLNATLQGIKALFYFHPIIHVLEKEAEEYRELYCDQNVLTDPDISEKNYAELLFELASKKVFRSNAAVSMAVNPSTLKKRIQVMKTQSDSLPPIKRSVLLMLVTGLLFTGFMACSDMEEGGITSSEVQEVQSQMNKPSPPTPAMKNEPLFIVNGERIEDDKSKEMFSRIKPKYIESIQVFKGEKAIELYGSAGKNGVVEVELIDKEIAYSDLRSTTPPPPPSNKSDENTFWVAVEDHPQIKGGIESIMSKVRYPSECKEAGIEGRVLVRFIVSEQGTVRDAEVIKGIGNSCDNEALRVIREAEFTPGMQRGKAVPVQMSMPIVFELPTSDSAAKLDVSRASIEESDMELRNFTVTENGSISGQIYSKKDNAPLAGANVELASSNKGTVTDNDGRFTIDSSADTNGNIKISFVGYTPIKAAFN